MPQIEVSIGLRREWETTVATMTEEREQVELSLAREERPSRKKGEIPALAVVLAVLAVAILLLVPYLILINRLLP